MLCKNWNWPIKSCPQNRILRLFSKFSASTRCLFYIEVPPPRNTDPMSKQKQKGPTLLWALLGIGRKSSPSNHSFRPNWTLKRGRMLTVNFFLLTKRAKTQHCGHYETKLHKTWRRVSLVLQSMEHRANSPSKLASGELAFGRNGRNSSKQFSILFISINHTKGKQKTTQYTGNLW